jgi:hypothetical protein
MKRIPPWMAYAALGPISGPLAAGVVRNWRKGARVLAALYVVAIVETLVLAPLLVERVMSLAGSS